MCDKVPFVAESAAKLVSDLTVIANSLVLCGVEYHMTSWWAVCYFVECVLVL